MIGALVLGAVVVAICAVVIRVTAVIEAAHHAHTDALAQQAADWSEPSRAQVEWEQHIAEAIRLTEADNTAWANWDNLPIYGQTVAHIAHNAAASLDTEWAQISDGTWER